jgi:hypothetical protein
MKLLNIHITSGKYKPERTPQKLIEKENLPLLMELFNLKIWK